MVLGPRSIAVSHAGPLHFLKLSSLFLYCAVEPGVRMNSSREGLVKARPQRGTAKAGRHAFSARSSFLTIRDSPSHAHHRRWRRQFVVAAQRPCWTNFTQNGGRKVKTCNRLLHNGHGKDSLKDLTPYRTTGFTFLCYSLCDARNRHKGADGRSPCARSGHQLGNCALLRTERASSQTTP